MVFDKNSDGIKMIFKYDYNSRMRFSRNISEKKEFKDNYFQRPGGSIQYYNFKLIYHEKFIISNLGFFGKCIS